MGQEGKGTFSSKHFAHIHVLYAQTRTEYRESGRSTWDFIALRVFEFAGAQKAVRYDCYNSEQRSR
jgi:hypothetical protein